MRRSFLLALILVLILSGCVSPAEKLDNSLIAQIRDGSSTREEVERLLGKPKVETTGSNGKRVAIYRHRESYKHGDESTALTLGPEYPETIYTKAEGQLLMRTLSVLFGPDGRVERHHFYESRTAISQNLVNTKLGAVVRPAQLAHIFRGQTQRSDLVQHFGEPLTEELTAFGNLVLSWIYLEGSGNVDFAPRGQLFEVTATLGGTVRDFRVVQDAGIGGKR